MPEKFQKALNELKVALEEMGHHARDMLLDGVESLKERNTDLANEVLDRKDRLYYFDNHIEEKTLKVLTLYQPMAKDLRFLGGILKMITYFTRIGRYGYDIAKVTLEIKDMPHVKKLIDIPNMAKMAASMIDDDLEAFRTGNTDLLKDFTERDDFLDEERYSIFRECLTYMMEDPRTITRCTHYVMVARYLERCGDHACKIAEKINYIETGEFVEIS